MLAKIHGEDVNLNEQTNDYIFGEDDTKSYFEIGFSDNGYCVVARKSIWDIQHEPILWAIGSNGDKIPGGSVKCLLENIGELNGSDLEYEYDSGEETIYGYTSENYGDKDEASVYYTIDYDGYFDKEANVQNFLKGAYLYQGTGGKDFDDDDIEIVG